MLWLRKLDIDIETFFEEHVIFRQTYEGNVLGVKVVELVNVSRNTSCIGANCRKNEQVLQVSVVGKVRSLQNNTFEQVDQFARKICCHECLHCTRDLVGIGGFRQGPFNNLVDELAALGVLAFVFFSFLLVENLTPQLKILAFDKILGKIAVQTMFVADLDELIIALASTLLVSDER